MAYNAELQKLRELAWWVLPRLKCYFCKKPMLSDPRDLKRWPVTFGHRRHMKVHSLVTLHHPNEDRQNPKAITVICHPVCHRRYHNEKREATTATTSVETPGNEQVLDAKGDRK